MRKEHTPNLNDLLACTVIESEYKKDTRLDNEDFFKILFLNKDKITVNILKKHVSKRLESITVEIIFNK